MDASKSFLTFFCYIHISAKGDSEIMSHKIDLKGEVMDLIERQQRKTAPEGKCPFDGLSCDAPLEYHCKIPVYLGTGHDKIIGWAGVCPRKTSP